MHSHVEDRQKPTLLPRFSIRSLLGLLTLFAVAFLIAGLAYRGQYWAWGVTIGLASLLVTALIHAAWFGIVWWFARMSSTQPKDIP
jgi:hypothetical protein